MVEAIGLSEKRVRVHSTRRIARRAFPIVRNTGEGRPWNMSGISHRWIRITGKRSRFVMTFVFSSSISIFVSVAVRIKIHETQRASRLVKRKEKKGEEGGKEKEEGREREEGARKEE